MTFFFPAAISMGLRPKDCILELHSPRSDLGNKKAKSAAFLFVTRRDPPSRCSREIEPGLAQVDARVIPLAQPEEAPK